jgi:hypothetical protein
MRRLLLLVCLATLPLWGCAGARSSSRATGEAAPRDVRAAVVRTAQRFVGQRRITVGGRALPADCWALPVAAYARNGLSLGGGNALGLYRAAAGVGRLYRDRPPRPGDLVFTSAGPTRGQSKTSPAGVGPDFHVGLVGEVDEDGTVLVYQRMARGVVTYRMNAGHPDTALSPATRRPWNDRIAAGPGETRLAGQLFAAYASFLP